MSYAHHDAEPDSPLLQSLTQTLAKKVQGNLVNAKFSIWHDRHIQIGEIWNDRLTKAIDRSQIFICLTSPRWYASDFCLREYARFLNREPVEAVQDFILPLIGRDSASQLHHFNDDQAKAYASVQARQYRPFPIDDFKRSVAARARMIEMVADDLTGMVERLRLLARAEAAPLAARPKRAQQLFEFDVRAHNIKRNGFLARSEILLRRSSDLAKQEVMAHVGFLNKLFIDTKLGRIEFSVRRAFLTLATPQGRPLEPQREWGHSPATDTCYYVSFADQPDALSICINPGSADYLADLPLPAAKGDNFYSRIAFASADLHPHEVSAKVTVSLSIEGLCLAGSEGSRVPASTLRKLSAVVEAYLEKGAEGFDSVMQEPVAVRSEEQ